MYTSQFFQERQNKVNKIGEVDYEHTHLHDHWVIYGIVEPQYCISGTKITLDVNYTGIERKEKNRNVHLRS